MFAENSEMQEELTATGNIGKIETSVPSIHPINVIKITKTTKTFFIPFSINTYSALRQIIFINNCYPTSVV